jgi:hypothetical protein
MALPLQLHLTLGPIEMGVLVSSVLWGLTCVQTYIYAMNADKDMLAMKLIVASVL